jgi:putative tricarboxylic transport membrane protein
MIALMMVIGAFAIQNNYHDIIIMLALGILAWTLGRFGFPAAPIILGILLGPIAEQGFSQALMIGNAKGDVIGMFFGRTVSLVLIGCIVAAIVLPTLLKHFTPKRYRAPAHAK